MIMSHSPDDVYILSSFHNGEVHLGASYIGITEKNCYTSEWTEEEQEKGFHKASLKFANNSKGERVKRVGSVSTPSAGTLESYGQVLSFLEMLNRRICMQRMVCIQLRELFPVIVLGRLELILHYNLHYNSVIVLGWRWSFLKQLSGRSPFLRSCIDEVDLLVFSSKVLHKDYSGSLGVSNGNISLAINQPNGPQDHANPATKAQIRTTTLYAGTFSITYVACKSTCRNTPTTTYNISLSLLV